MASDLFCCERLQPELRKAGKDPVIFLDSRVLHNLLDLEKQYIPHCDYFSEVQFDIKPFMRKVVTTWMLELCEELGLEDQVFPLAVNYLDRFLCSCNINKRHLQLAASVCIMLASKIRQCQYVSMETLCFYSDHSITCQQIKEWEILVLSKLKWNVASVTGFDYIDHIIDRVPWGTENALIRRHATTLVGICYTGHMMSMSEEATLWSLGGKSICSKCYYCLIRFAAEESKAVYVTLLYQQVRLRKARDLHAYGNLILGRLILSVERVEGSPVTNNGSEPDFIHIRPSVIATASICSAARGLKIPSSAVTLTSMCQLLRLSSPDSIEPVVKRIEEVLEAEASGIQEEPALSSKTGNYPNTPSSTPANKQDTIDGHPETPTDVQDIYF